MSEDQGNTSKSGGMFHMSSLSDEIVVRASSSAPAAAPAPAPAPSPSAKNTKRAGSRERTKRKTKATAKEATTASVDSQHQQAPVASSSSSQQQQEKQRTRSLSPRKTIVRNISGSLTPMLTPVMKGLKLLSRNVRSPSPTAAAAAAAAANDDHADRLPLVSSSSSTEQQQPPPPQPLNAFAAFSRARPTGLSAAMKPVSGRFDVTPDDDDDDDDEHDNDDPPLRRTTSRPSPTSPLNSNKPSVLGPPAHPNKPSSSSSAGSAAAENKPSSSRSSSTKKPSSSTSNSSSKPLSWSSTSSKQKPPSSSSAGSSGGENKPSSSSSIKKPHSSSSAGSAASETTTAPAVPPRPSSVDRRRVPRHPHRKSDESNNKTTIQRGGRTTDDGDETPRPRRARSATPTTSSSSRRGRSEEAATAMAKTQRDPAERSSTTASTADLSPVRRRSSSQKSTTSRRDSSNNKRESSRQHESASASSGASASLKPRRPRSKSPQKAAADADAAGLLRLKAAETTTEENRTGKIVRDQASIIQAHERRERPRQARSVSRDKSSRASPEGRDKPRRTRSKSREKSSNAEPIEDKQPTTRAPRRGRRPNAKEDSVNPASNTSLDEIEQGIVQVQNQQGNVVSLDELIGKPDPGRRQAELQRSNLDKDALEHVKSLKDDLKQMRMQRQKIKFGSSQEGSTEAPHRAVRSSSDGATPLQQHLQTPYPTKSPGRSRRTIPAGSQASLNVSQLHLSGSTQFTTSKSDFNSSKSTTLTNKSDYNSSKSTAFTLKSELNSSRSTVQSSKTDASLKDYSTSKLVTDFNSSYISIGDLDVGYLKPPAPVRPEHELQIEALQKRIKKTKKLIKRTTRDVWTEREEIIHLQRTNWSIRKALMQNEGPPDSLTTLNMKIEKLLRQERELDLESDRIREEKEALEKDCVKTTKGIGEFRDLYDKLNRTIVPLLPVPENTPQEVEASDYMGAEPISPLPSPSGTNRRAIPRPASSSAPHFPGVERMNSVATMADSLHSTEEEHVPENNQELEEEGSLSLSHLRLAMPSRVSY